MSQVPLRSEFADDPDMAELVQRFVADLPVRIASLRSAAADPGDLASLRRLAHQMKGAAGGYGFPQITDAAGRLEDTLSGATPAPDAPQALEDLVALCARACMTGQS